MKKIDVNQDLVAKTEEFNKNISSKMKFRSELSSAMLEFEWLTKIEEACPYLDNIIRKPRLSLVSESDVVKIEKAKKVTIESVKDLSKHTQYIDKLDKITQEVQPSKILITRREETYSTYENRFVYTLIDKLSRFVTQMERLLNDIKEKKDKVLEYSSSTTNGSERVVMEMKVSTKKLADDDQKGNFDKELEQIEKRLDKVGIYMNSWQKSVFVTSIIKDRSSFVKAPIKKTNMILKNPNFRVAMKLWEYISQYDDDNDGNSTEGMESEGDNTLKEVLNDSFLTDYFVLDSISKSKKEQREKLTQYGIIMIRNQMHRIVSLLASSGIELTDEQLMALITEELNKEKEKKQIVSLDVKNKFKDALEEYLEKTEDYL